MNKVRWICVVVCCLGIALLAGLPVSAAQKLQIMTHLTDAQWQPYYDQFTKDTGIQIELVNQEWGQLDKLVTSVAGGVAPDLVQLDTNPLVQAAYNGLLLDLAPFLQKDTELKLADFYPPVIEAVSSKGAVYGLPTGLDIYLLYYNRSMFDATGLGDPPADWTYTDYLKYAQKITKGEGANRVWGSNFYQWETAAYAGGGDYITPDGKFGMMGENTINAIQWAFDLANVYGVAPKWGEIPEGFHVRFTAGRTATHQAGPWYRRYNINQANTSIDWGIANPPRWEGGSAAAQLFLGAWAIPATSRQHDLAWKFIKWAESKQGAKIADGIVANLPTRRSLAQDNDLLIWTEFGKYRQILMNTVAVGRTLPFDIRANEVRSVVTSVIGDPESGNKSVRQAFEEILPKVNAILEKK